MNLRIIKLGMKKNEIADYKKFAENIMDNFNYSNVINELKKSKYVVLKSPLNTEVNEVKINFNVVIFPILNYRNDISNYACVFESEEMFREHAQRKSAFPFQHENKKIPAEVQDLPLYNKFKELFR